jgi:Uma2 family endonuclease
LACLQHHYSLCVSENREYNPFMTTIAPHRRLIPGTTGWTVDDLDDPHIERLWSLGRYEIVEGVLTLMAAAAFDGGLALTRLIRIVSNYTLANGLGDTLATEVDLILNKRRLPIVDAVYLSPDDLVKQKAAHAATGKRKKLKYGRILVPPTLVIESISLEHESHDRETKRGWYAEASIPNYWLLDGQQRSLECLVLEGADYRVDQAGHNTDELKPSLFPGLVIPLGQLWAE